MQIFKFLWNYKIGMIGGVVYTIFSVLIIYDFALCTSSGGFCITIAPALFHQTVIELLTGTPTNSWLFSLINLIIFILEGIGIEFLAQKLS